MLIFNLLIIFLVIGLSYIFKLTEIKKYDTQLVFILLTFTVLVVYKTVNYLYNKRESFKAVKNLVEKFNDTMVLNDFISDTLSDREKIIALEKKVKQYEDVYDTSNILNNDLDNKIKFTEDALAKLSDEYIVDLEKSNPGGNNIQIGIEASEEGIITPPINASNNVDTNAVKNTIIKFLEAVNNKMISV